MIATERLSLDGVWNSLTRAAGVCAAFSTAFLVSYHLAYETAELIKRWSPTEVAVDLSLVQKSPTIRLSTGSGISAYMMDYGMSFDVQKAPPLKIAQKSVRHLKKRAAVRPSQQAQAKLQSKVSIQNQDVESNKKTNIHDLILSIHHQIRSNYKVSFIGAPAEDHLKTAFSSAESTVHTQAHSDQTDSSVQEPQPKHIPLKEVAKSPEIKKVQNRISSSKPKTKPESEFKVLHAQKLETKREKKIIPQSQHEAKSFSAGEAKNTVIASSGQRVQPTEAVRAFAPAMNRSETTPSFIEALSYPRVEIGMVDQELISSTQVGDSNQVAWKLFSKNGYLQTIALLNTQAAYQIPLFSEFNWKLLLRKAGIQESEYSGAVFVEYAQGNEVELSLRSAKTLYFDSNNQLVDERSPSKTKALFLNTAPGALLVYNGRKASPITASVPGWVQSKALTYIDLRMQSESQIRGKVVSVDQSEIGNRTEVRVIGQPHVISVTDQSGRFQLKGVIRTGDYPIIIEVRGSKVHPHRYTLNPKQGMEPSLYLFSNEKISEWTAQIEGGIRSDSGIMIGAVPRLVQTHVSLYPGVEAVSSPENAPETYVISGSGELMVGQALAEENTRLLSVQVPEGVNILRLESNTQDQLSSELIFASPGVVNIVGPY